MINDVSKPIRIRRGRSLSRRTKVIGVGLGLIMASGLLASEAYGGNPPQAQQVIVQPGDTLWGIASTAYGSSGDIRDHIAEIMSANDLSSGNIQAGEVLTLPAS